MTGSEGPWQSSNTIAAAALKPIVWNKTYRWVVIVGDGVAHTWSAPVWFRASVPPPSTPGWRGGDDPFSGFKGGVNLVTGNYFASQLDVSVASVGPKLEVERSYNSLDPRVGFFGKGWSTLLDFRIDALTTPTGMTVRRPDGRVEFYGRNSDGVSYEPPFGLGSRFRQCVAGDAPVCPGTNYLLTDPDGTTFQFQANGLLARVTDEFGHELRFVWSGGAPVTIGSYASPSLPDNQMMRTLTFATTTEPVSGAVLVTSVSTDPVAGQVSTWAYGYSGTNLTSVNDPINPAPSTVRTVYEYEGVGGRLSTWKNPGNTSFVANTEIELSYQTDGKVAWRKDGTGGQHTYDYTTTPISPETLRVTVTDPRGKTTVWGFDDRKRLIVRVNERGLTRSWAYNAQNGFLGQVVFEDGGSETFEDHTAAGLARKQTVIRDGVARVSYFEFNAQNNPTAVRDPRSASATDNTFLSSTTYDSTGKKVISETKPGFAPTTFEWTTGTETAVGGGGNMPPGLLKKKTEPVAGTVAAASYAFTTYGYDVKGNLKTMVDPAGKTTTYTYDELGRELTRTETGNGIPAGAVWTTAYDKLSRPTAVTEPEVTNAVTSTARRLRTNTFYDNNGNVDRTEQVAVTGGGTTRVTTYSYDAADRKKTETVAHGTAIAAITKTDYDANGNVIATTDPLQRVYDTTFTDDNLPDVTTLLGYQPDPQFNPTTTMTLMVRDLDYDNAGRVSVETDAEQGVAKWAGLGSRFWWGAVRLA